VETAPPSQKAWMWLQFTRNRRVIGGLLLWTLLWAGLNTVDPSGHGMTRWLSEVRGCLPLLAGGLAAMVLLRGLHAWEGWEPLLLMAAYGLLGLVSSVFFSPDPAVASYWASLYLAVPVVLLCIKRSDVGSLALLLNVTWLFVAAIGSLLVAIAVWAIGPHGGRSLYAAIAFLPSVGGIPMVRSTGIARYAAIIGLVALARILYGRRLIVRVAWSVGALLCGLILWYSLSAGASVACLVAVFVILLLSRNTRLIMAVIVMGLGATWLFHDTIWRNLFRAKTIDHFFSGRFDIWRSAWEMLIDSPALGFGFHADRLLMEWPFHNHISNAFLHAFVQSGVLGGILFALAWVWVCWLLVRWIRGTWTQSAAIRLTVMEVTGVMVFLTLRALFESSGAFFGVDWLILSVLMAYVFAVTRSPGCSGLVSAAPRGPAKAWQT